MKLFIIAALVAVASAARLDHLERGYLPPSGGHGNYGASAGSNGLSNGAAHGSFGLNNQGSQYNDAYHGSNGFGAHGSNGVSGHGSNGFGASGHGSNGFGASAHGSNGFGSNGARGSNGFGSKGYRAPGHSSNGFGSNGASARVSADEATSNQYLPPNRGPSGSNGANTYGSSIRPACSVCGSSSFGTAPQRYSTHQSPQTIGSHPTFGAQQDEHQFNDVSSQYQAPKDSSSQSYPQQPFDEKTGYIY